MKLTKEQFRKAIKCGHGRAWLHVQESKPEEVRDELLAGCLKDQTYDLQIEAYRGAWLYELIKMTGDVTWYADRIAEALRTVEPKENNWDAEHLANLALSFTSQGNQSVLAAVEERFRQPLDEMNCNFQTWLAMALLASGGIDLLLPTSRKLAKLLPEIDLGVECWSLSEAAYKKFGKEETLTFLRHHSDTDPLVAAFLKQIDETENYDHESESAEGQGVGKSPSKKLLREWLDELNEQSGEDECLDSYFLERACRKASEEERREAFECLLPKIGEKKYAFFLFRMFGRQTPMPEFREELLPFTICDDEKLSWAALMAFAGFAHPRVHDFALDYITRQELPHAHRMINLLNGNYQPGDETAILALLEKGLPEDEFHLHSIGMTIYNIAEKNGDSVIPLLLWAYEEAPCTHCREDFFRELLRRQAAPDWMRDEARYDCREETRELAAREYGFLFFWGHTPGWFVGADKSCLSQWFPAAFEVDGVTYATAEHFMMASKARVFEDTDKLEKILATSSPRKAKSLGRKVANFDAAIWREHSFEIVKQGNLAKFSQNSELQEFLLQETEDLTLVEASPVDKIWGIGLAEDHPDAVNPEKWQGENLLGKALMEVREVLRSRTE